MSKEMVVREDAATEKKAIKLERQIDEELKWGLDTRKESEWRFARLARNLAAYEDNELWRGRHQSMNAFLEQRAEKCQVKRSTIYGVLHVGRRLAPHLTDEQMRQIGKSKLYLIANQTSDDSPPAKDLVKKALDEKVSFKEFESYVKGKKLLLPGEKVEDFDLQKVQAFWVSRQDHELVEKVFALARRIESVESRDKIFVMMCEIAHAHWLNEEQAQEEA